MNQTHKEIAKIFAKYLKPLIEEKKRLLEIQEKERKAKDRKGYWATNQLLKRCQEKISLLGDVIVQQADYFEEEDNNNHKVINIDTRKEHFGLPYEFNRDQFKEWCGVE